MIDLRSDTVTRPSAAMRKVIAAAEVGDDLLGDDPTVKRLEHMAAELLGKEAALFFPTGTMANATAINILTRPGTEVILEQHAHIFEWELGGPAVFSGVQLRPVPTPDGLLTAQLVAGAIRPGYQLRTSLVCVENTHNGSGGRVMPKAQMAAISDVARKNNLPLHLDGARLWNASAASGIPEVEFAALADTVMISLSKGLGCPVGSLLAGTRDHMDAARPVRRRLGGALRQSGILAAAGIYAIENNRARLHEDHENAQLLAERVGVQKPESNIVMIDVANAADVVAKLKEQGVLLVEYSPTRVRAITHLDVSRADVERAADALARVLT
ncbi:MAG TPA: GntG family PLP-dependent aldolase [Longimicrobiales bacterium]